MEVDSHNNQSKVEENGLHGQGDEDLEYADPIILERGFLNLQLHDPAIMDSDVDIASNDEISEFEDSENGEDSEYIAYPDIAEAPSLQLTRFAERTHLPPVVEEDESALTDDSFDEPPHKVVTVPRLGFGAHRGYYKEARNTLASQERELLFRHEEERIESLIERMRRFDEMQSSTPMIVVSGAPEDALVEDDPESPCDTLFDIVQFDEYDQYGSFIDLTSDSVTISDESENGSGYPETMSSESTLK